MKIKTIGFWKGITTWGGFLIAVSGACHALSIGKLDAVSGSLTFVGLALNGVGNLIGMAQAKRQKADTANAEARLLTAEAKIRDLEPKPFPERLILFGLQIDGRFRELIEAGERTFRMRLNAYQYGQLEAFAKEDSRVAVSHSTNTNVGPSGSVIEATLQIGAGVIPAK